MAGDFGIGQSVARYEDPRLLRGRGRYVADMVFPNMLHSYVLRSPHAKADILSVDISKVSSERSEQNSLSKTFFSATINSNAASAVIFTIQKYEEY